MMPFHRPFTLLAVLTLLAGFSLTAQAQPVLTEHVPADAVVVVSWRGTELAGDDYTDSRFKAFLDDTKLPEKFGEVFGQFIELGGNDRETKLIGSFFEKVLPAAVARPWVFYVSSIGVDQNGNPSPRLGFLMDPGEGEIGEAVETWLVEQFEEIEGEVDAQLVEYGDLIGIIVAHDFLDPDLPDAPKAIKADDDFKKTLKGLGDKPMFVGYVDVDGGRQLLFDGMKLDGSDEEQLATAEAVLKALGLDGVHHLAITGAFEKRDWVQRAYVNAPAPRRGLAKLLEGGTVDEAVLAKMSPTTRWFRSMRLDPAEVLKIVRDTVEAAEGEDALIDFEMALKEGSGEVGFDIEKDLIDAVGDRWTIYNEPGFGNIAGFYPGVALLNDLDNAEKVDASLIKFKDWMNQMVKDEGATFQFVSMEMGDFTVHSMAFPMVSPSWAVTDGRMYAAASATAIVTANNNAKNPEGTVATNASYKQVRARLAELAGEDAQPIGLMYADLPQSAFEMYNAYVSTLAMLTGFMNQFGEQGPNLVALMPKYNEIQPHLAPAGDIMWADNDGLHYASVQPFPFATLLSPDAALSSGMGVPALVPMTFGVLMPAVGGARRTAWQIQSSTQARGIHQGMIIHAQGNRPANGGDAPLSDDIAELYDNDMFTADYTLAPTSGIMLPDDFEEWGKDKRHNWLHKNTSFVIIPGLVEDLDTTKVAVFLKPSHSNGKGITVTMNDNSTSWMDLDEAEKKIKKQTGKSIDELVKAAEARAAEGTPDVLAKARAEREQVIAEIRARREAELKQ